MTKLLRFFGTCLLVVSLFSIALAGDTLTPPRANTDLSDCSSSASGTDVSAITRPAPDSNDELVPVLDLLTAWFVASIQ